jgi:hypothetical protein
MIKTSPCQQLVLDKLSCLHVFKSACSGTGHRKGIAYRNTRN